MVLPLMLGLLGVGAAGAAGSRLFTDWADERKEDRAREKQGAVWDGLLAEQGMGGAAAPPGMGILDPEQAQGAGGSQRGFLGVEGVRQIPGQDGAGMPGQAGPGQAGPGQGGGLPDMARLAQGLGGAGYIPEALGILSAERGYEVQEGAATTAFNRSLQRDEIQHGYRTAEIGQSQGPAWARLAFDQSQAAAERGRLPEYEGVRVTPEAYMKFAGQDAAVDTIAQVRAYADQTSGAQRAFDTETRARLASEYQMTVLPAMQKMFEAGAMQKEELELFRKLGGDPLAYSNFSSAERGKVSAVLNKLEEQRRIERAAYGVPYVPRTLSGSSGGGGGAGPNAPGLSGG